VSDLRSAPRVSIGLPVYNGARYIEQTLESILNQTFTDFVVIISDNASTDDTQDICRRYARRDGRIVYSRHPENIGAAGNYERCFLPAASEYFRWHNADDTIDHTLVEKCVAVLDSDPNIVLAYGKTQFIDSEGNSLGPYDDNLELLQDTASERFAACLRNIRLQHVMYGLIRRHTLAKTARMRPYVSADINLIAELSLYGKFFELPEYLFHCRRHERCLSWDMTNQEKVREFWNPQKKKVFLSTWRNVFEYYRAVFRAPIEYAEKRAVCCFLIKHAYWFKGALGSELYEFMKYWLLDRSLPVSGRRT